MLHRLIIIMLILSLGACASSPSSGDQTTSYYLFDTTVPTLSKQQASTRIVLEPLDIAAYLKQPNLVLKNDDNSLRVANYHLWANPLPESIKRALNNDFLVIRSDIMMVATCTTCKRLKLSIEHFYPDSTGIVTLSGSYSIVQTDQTVTTSYFSITDSIQQDGYQAAVQTMRQLLSSLAEQIAGEL